MGFFSLPRLLIVAGCRIIVTDRQLERRTLKCDRSSCRGRIGRGRRSLLKRDHLFGAARINLLLLFNLAFCS